MLCAQAVVPEGKEIGIAAHGVIGMLVSQRIVLGAICPSGEGDRRVRKSGRACAQGFDVAHRCPIL
jgi:hypothetical protein